MYQDRPQHNERQHNTEINDPLKNPRSGLRQYAVP